MMEDISENQIQKTESENVSQKVNQNPIDEYMQDVDDNQKNIKKNQQSNNFSRSLKSRDHSTNQGASKKQNNLNLIEYKVDILNYSSFEKLLENINDQAKFKSSMKRINFFANLTQAEAEEIQKLYVNEEINPITLERNNKDQCITLEFTSEKQKCMQYFENKFLNQKKVNQEIDYQMLDQCINIQNKNMNKAQFDSLHNEMKTNRDGIVSISICMSDLFSQNKDIFNNKQDQVAFLSSSFLKYNMQKYNLITIDLQNDKNSSSVSFSLSESEFESEQSILRNYEKFTGDSKLVLFGINYQNLEDCKENLKNYINKPVNLDFSVLTSIKENEDENRADNNKSQNLEKFRRKIIKAKIQLFNLAFQKQIEEKIDDKIQKKGLVGQKEVENEYQEVIRYRLDGDQRDIEEFENWCNRNVQNIHGYVIYTVQNDQFLEKIQRPKIKSIADKVNNDHKNMLINTEDELSIFVYLKSPESETQKEIKQIVDQLVYISQLKRVRLQADISIQLAKQFEDFQEITEQDRNRYGQIEKSGKNIHLIGSQQQIENTKSAIEEYIKKNIQKVFCLDKNPNNPRLVNNLTKNIFQKYFYQKFKDDFIDFEFDNKKSLSEDTFEYKITQFNKQELERKLYKCLEDICKEVSAQEKVIFCTQNQFQVLQKEKTYLQQVQEQCCVEIIADPKKLNEMGHTVQQLDVNQFHVQKQLVFSTTNPKIQICVLSGDIKNIQIDSIMINMKLDGNYIDQNSKQIVEKTECGKFIIEEINQKNAGTSKLLFDYKLESDDEGQDMLNLNLNLKQRKNQKKKFQYFSVCHLNTSFPTKHICISVLNKDQSNVKYLLKEFFKENMQNFKIGINIPQEEGLDELYIQNLRELLFDLYGDDNKQIKQKNIFLFCEERQIQRLSYLVQKKIEKQMLMNKIQNPDDLFNQSKKQFYINKEQVPYEFHLLLELFTTGKNRGQERFYAFLPKPVEQGVKLDVIKICINSQDSALDAVISGNSKYSYESYLENSYFSKEDKDDIKKAVQKARESKIEILYLYEDEDGNFQSELVRVNLKKRKIAFQRNKQSVEYEDEDVQQSENTKFVYLIKGYKKEDLDHAQNEVNSKLFINLKYFEDLWDYNYVDENIPKMVSLNKSSENQKKTFYSFEKIFRKKQMKILEIQFIQSIPLYQKFQEQVSKLYYKCNTDTVIQEAMFYCHYDYSVIRSIFECNQIGKQILLFKFHPKNIQKQKGFDPRVHHNFAKNPNVILLQNKPEMCQNNGDEAYCIACFVIKGKVLQQNIYTEDFIQLKRLPQDKTDKQYYDSVIMEEDKDLSVAIFDFDRIYPSYLIKFQKSVESETNYTTDDQSRNDKKK